MGRGGAGRNQGRNPTLSDEDQIWIGATCEKLRDGHVEKTTNRAAKKKSAPHELEMLLDDMNRVPIKDRAMFVQLAIEIEIHGIDAVTDSRDIPEHIVDAAEALVNRRIALRKIDQITLSKRPYRFRSEVKKRVSELATMRFGKPISERYVVRCWNEYARNFKRSDDS